MAVEFHHAIALARNVRDASRRIEKLVLADDYVAAKEELDEL